MDATGQDKLECRLYARFEFDAGSDIFFYEIIYTKQYRVACKYRKEI